jgi:hypothetical protein
MSMMWVGIGSAVLSAGTTVYASQQQKKIANQSLDAQRQIIAEDVKYEPIDIEKLKRNAQANAIENATASLAIERGLQPDVAAVRAELARQVSTDLQRGGELPADVANRATTAGRVAGARSGIGTGAAVPLTASLLGISSLDLINQRRAAATNLLNANALPMGGLDPGALASAEIANNAAYNQFNLEKAGVESSLVQSEADARAAQLAGQVASVNASAAAIGKIAGAYGSQNTPTNYADLLNRTRTPTTYYNQNPATNPIMGSSALGLV